MVLSFSCSELHFWVCVLLTFPWIVCFKLSVRSCLRELRHVVFCSSVMRWYFSWRLWVLVIGSIYFRGLFVCGGICEVIIWWQNSPRGGQVSALHFHVSLQQWQISVYFCIQFYMGKTSHQLKTRIHEHELAVNHHNPKSLIATHTDTEQHQFDWSNIRTINHATNRHAYEFIEAWHSRKLFHQ